MDQILQGISETLKTRFLFIWITTLLVAVFYSLFFASRKKRDASNVSVSSIAYGRWEFGFITDFTFVLIFFLLMTCYLFLMFVGEDFAYYDNHIFTDGVLRGVQIHWPISTGNGRYFPLGHQEWNLIANLSKSPVAFHAFPAAQLLLVVAGLFFFLIRFPLWLRLLTIVAILLTPSFLTSFFGLIFPERNVIFWLVIFLVVFQHYESSRSMVSAAIILGSVQFALYYKEPFFLILLTFSILRLVLSDRIAPPKQAAAGRCSFIVKHHIELGIIMLCLIFLLQYGLINAPSRSLSFATQSSIGQFPALRQYISHNFLLDIFLITLIARSYSLLRRSKIPDPFWDPLALGSLLYLLSYVILGLYNRYYTAPVDLIAVLYLARLFYQHLSSHTRVVVSGVVLLTFVISQNILYSFHEISDRKNLITGTTAVGNFLNAYSRETNAPRRVNLFFPGATQGWILQGVSSYWRYKGLSFVGYGTHRNKRSSVFVVKSPIRLRDNRCAYWGPQYRCFYAESPEPDDLIIILPNDEISPEHLTELRRNSVLLFHYPAVLPDPLAKGNIDGFVFQTK